MQRNTITLEHPTDWQGFRTAARALVQANVPPQAVDWRCQADVWIGWSGFQSFVPAYYQSKRKGEQIYRRP